ncbi:MAG: hypothetical protein J0I79_07055 [Mesorhizobium sp.]|uniref:hypothetical protein n=1 Tax=Mesorhizobium sp. TaxID=1871066 RepID=UPI001AC0D2B6|nr:hypothetical protein [Mesorhizobium sp.]MBN9217694.1 hypothetical protein [Mesorhizobium sp.]
MTNNSRVYRVSRITLVLLYCLFFAGFAIAPVWLRIAHWIERTEGPKILLVCIVGHVAAMSAVAWVINRINQIFPPLVLPPAHSVSSSAYEIVETSSEADKAEAVFTKTNIPRR